MAADWPAIVELENLGLITTVVEARRRRQVGDVERVYVYLNRHLGIGELDIRFRFSGERPAFNPVSGSKKMGVSLIHQLLTFFTQLDVSPSNLCTRSLFFHGWFWQGPSANTPGRYLVVAWRPSTSFPYVAISPVIDWTALPIGGAPPCKLP